jgi:hypothetical protein
LKTTEAIFEMQKYLEKIKSTDNNLITNYFMTNENLEQYHGQGNIKFFTLLKRRYYSVRVVQMKMALIFAIF